MCHRQSSSQFSVCQYLDVLAASRRCTVPSVPNPLLLLRATSSLSAFFVAFFLAAFGVADFSFGLRGRLLHLGLLLRQVGGLEGLAVVGDLGDADGAESTGDVRAVSCIASCACNGRRGSWRRGPSSTTSPTTRASLAGRTISPAEAETASTSSNSTWPSVPVPPSRLGSHPRAPPGTAYRRRG